jgi:type IV fimbrial biogenesis protein FimT
MRPREQREHGFTVIELMITVVILAVLIAIGAPAFNELVLSTRIKNAASDIYGSLIYARSEAIKRGTNVTVTPAGGLWINGWQVAAGAIALKNQDAFSKLKIECPTGTDCAQTVTYRRDGRLSGAVTLTFVVDETSPPTPRRVAMRCVTVGVSGQINVLSDTNLDGNCSNG